MVFNDTRVGRRVAAVVAHPGGVIGTPDTHCCFPRVRPVSVLPAARRWCVRWCGGGRPRPQAKGPGRACGSVPVVWQSVAGARPKPYVFRRLPACAGWIHARRRIGRPASCVCGRSPTRKKRLEQERVPADLFATRFPRSRRCHTGSATCPSRRAWSPTTCRSRRRQAAEGSHHLPIPWP